MAIFNDLRGRIPRAAQIAAVYAVIVVTVYSWTLLWFFWKYPSWLFFLNIGEILGVLSYALATNFFESLAVLIAPLVIVVILPKKWFYDAFIARGIALVLPGLGYMMYVAFQFQSKLDYPSAVLNWFPVVLGATVLLVFLAGRLNFLRKAIEIFADRATVFLFLSIPASLIAIISILVVMVSRWIHA